MRDIDGGIVNDVKQMLFELASIRGDMVVLKEGVQKLNGVNKTIYVIRLANIAICLCFWLLLCIDLVVVVSKWDEWM